MASSTEIAKHHFDALNAHDLDAALALWVAGDLPGHANPVTGDVVTQLEHAASGPA